MMTQLPLQCRRLVGFAVVAACLIEAAPSADGQIVELSQAVIAQRGYGSYDYGYGHYGNYYGAVDALASRVYSHAALLHASGHAMVNYARAREIRAYARRQEIKNALAAIETIWKIRGIGETELYKRRTNLLDSRRRQNSKTWDRLKNLSEFNGPAIKNGRALNFLLHRLSGNILAYEYSRDYSSSGDTVLQQLALPPGMLNGLQLRQHLPDGQSLIFTADNPAPLNVDWWPYVLRGDEFKTYRDDFQKKREQIVKEARDGKISNKSLDAVAQSYVRLSAEFVDRFDHKRRQKNGMQSWRQYKQGDAFLRSMWGEIGRMQAVGDVSFLDGDLLFDRDRDGANLVSLLRFMARNGLDFAPSKPGGESSYNQAFTMMRDLYANVADDDEALQPQTEKYQR